MGRGMGGWGGEAQGWAWCERPALAPARAQPPAPLNPASPAPPPPPPPTLPPQVMLMSFLGPAVQCQWDLHPDQLRALTSLVFAGMVVGGPLWGCISDGFGRKTAFAMSVICTTAFGILSAAAQTFEARGRGRRGGREAARSRQPGGGRSAAGCASRPPPSHVAKCRPPPPNRRSSRSAFSSASASRARACRSGCSWSLCRRRRAASSSSPSVGLF
jgi:hypothetical protein